MRETRKENKHIKVKDLKPAAYNPRKITDAQLARLKKSLEEFGDLSGIVFNTRTQTMVSGHQRVKNIDADCKITKQPHTDKTGTVALGYIDTPVGRFAYREVDWPGDKEKKANIAANKHGGEFDDDLLKELLDDLKLEDPLDIELIGFDEIPFQDDPHTMLKNYTGNYGGAKDDKDHCDAHAQNTEERFPITVILNQTDYKKWQKIKEVFGVKSDKIAFIKLIGGNHA